jgi:hypothetical protein
MDSWTFLDLDGRDDRMVLEALEKQRYLRRIALHPE